MLSKSAQPSAKREDGQTAIHLCAKNDSVEILEKLIDAGGDISEVDNDTETILHKAAAHNKEDVLRYVLSKQVKCPCCRRFFGIENLSLFLDEYRFYSEEE